MVFFSPKGEPLLNPYHVLKLEFGASDDDIAKAFKTLILRLHPDKQPADQSEAEADKISNQFHDVKDAKCFLLDGDHLASRREFDSRLAATEKSKAAANAQKHAQTKSQTHSPQTKVLPRQKQQQAASNPMKDHPSSKYISSTCKEKATAQPKKQALNRQVWGRVKRQSELTMAEKLSGCTSRSKDVSSLPRKDPSLRKISKAEENTFAATSNWRKRFFTGKSLAAKKKTEVAKPFSSKKASTSESIKKQQCDSKKPNQTNKNGMRLSSANGSDRHVKETSHSNNTASGFEAFQPVVATLAKQYHCPLTGQIICEPMTDFEGNSYEKDVILKYLETSNTSPVTGKPLYPTHLTPNSALKERIKYTQQLKVCLDALTSQEESLPASRFIDERITPSSRQRHKKPISLRRSVDNFIEEINSASYYNNITIHHDSRKAFFTYTGLDYTLQVPCNESNNVIIQTWFEHDRKAARIPARIVEWNRSLQENGIRGKLAFRKSDVKFAFTLTFISTEKFSKTSLKHAMEYYLEMSINLHNAINVTDQKRVHKVRL